MSSTIKDKNPPSPQPDKKTKPEVLESVKRIQENQLEFSQNTDVEEREGKEETSLPLQDSADETYESSDNSKETENLKPKENPPQQSETDDTEKGIKETFFNWVKGLGKSSKKEDSKEAKLDGFSVPGEELGAANISLEQLRREDLYQNIKHKKGLLTWTKWICAIQLVVLNIIILGITFYQFCVLPKEASLIQLPSFDYTKIYENYYSLVQFFIGATFVELIGIIGIIVKGVFNRKMGE